MKGVLCKFNPGSSCTEEQARSAKEWRLMQKLERGERLALGELRPLFGELQNPEGYCRAIVRRAGWLYDFMPYFRRYLVNEKYSGWREVYAYNKTAVRQLNAIPSHVLEIAEIPKRWRAVRCPGT